MDLIKGQILNFGKQKFDPTVEGRVIVFDTVQVQGNLHTLLPAQFSPSIPSALISKQVDGEEEIIYHLAIGNRIRIPIVHSMHIRPTYSDVHQENFHSSNNSTNLKNTFVIICKDGKELHLRLPNANSFQEWHTAFCNTMQYLLFHLAFQHLPDGNLSIKRLEYVAKKAIHYVPEHQEDLLRIKRIWNIKIDLNEIICRLQQDIKNLSRNDVQLFLKRAQIDTLILYDTQYKQLCDLEHKLLWQYELDLLASSKQRALQNKKKHHHKKKKTTNNTKKQKKYSPDYVHHSMLNENKNDEDVEVAQEGEYWIEESLSSENDDCSDSNSSDDSEDKSSLEDGEAATHNQHNEIDELGEISLTDDHFNQSSSFSTPTKKTSSVHSSPNQTNSIGHHRIPAAGGLPPRTPQTQSRQKHQYTANKALLRTPNALISATDDIVLEEEDYDYHHHGHGHSHSLDTSHGSILEDSFYAEEESALHDDDHDDEIIVGTETEGIVITTSAEESLQEGEEVYDKLKQVEAEEEQEGDDDQEHEDEVEVEEILMNTEKDVLLPFPISPIKPNTLPHQIIQQPITPPKRMTKETVDQASSPINIPTTQQGMQTSPITITILSSCDQACDTQDLSEFVSIASSSPSTKQEHQEEVAATPSSAVAAEAPSSSFIFKKLNLHQEEVDQLNEIIDFLSELSGGSGSSSSNSSYSQHSLTTPNTTSSKTSANRSLFEEEEGSTSELLITDVLTPMVTSSSSKKMNQNHQQLPPPQQQQQPQPQKPLCFTDFVTSLEDDNDEPMDEHMLELLNNTSMNSSDSSNNSVSSYSSNGSKSIPFDSIYQDTAEECIPNYAETIPNYQPFVGTSSTSMSYKLNLSSKEIHTIYEEDDSESESVHVIEEVNDLMNCSASSVSHQSSSQHSSEVEELLLSDKGSPQSLSSSISSSEGTGTTNTTTSTTTAQELAKVSIITEEDNSPPHLKDNDYLSHETTFANFPLSSTPIKLILYSPSRITRRSYIPLNMSNHSEANTTHDTHDTFFHSQDTSLAMSLSVSASSPVHRIDSMKEQEDAVDEGAKEETMVLIASPEITNYHKLLHQFTHGNNSEHGDDDHEEEERDEEEDGGEESDLEHSSIVRSLDASLQSVDTSIISSSLSSHKSQLLISPLSLTEKNEEKLDDEVIMIGNDVSVLEPSKEAEETEEVKIITTDEVEQVMNLVDVVEVIDVVAHRVEEVPLIATTTATIAAVDTTPSHSPESNSNSLSISTISSMTSCSGCYVGPHGGVEVNMNMSGGEDMNVATTFASPVTNSTLLFSPSSPFPPNTIDTLPTTPDNSNNNNNHHVVALLSPASTIQTNTSGSTTNTTTSSSSLTSSSTSPCLLPMALQSTPPALRRVITKVTPYPHNQHNSKQSVTGNSSNSHVSTLFRPFSTISASVDDEQVVMKKRRKKHYMHWTMKVYICFMLVLMMWGSYLRYTASDMLYYRQEVEEYWSKAISSSSNNTRYYLNMIKETTSIASSRKTNEEQISKESSSNDLPTTIQQFNTIPFPSSSSSSSLSKAASIPSALTSKFHSSPSGITIQSMRVDVYTHHHPHSQPPAYVAAAVDQHNNNALVIVKRSFLLTPLITLVHWTKILFIRLFAFVTRRDHDQKKKETVPLMDQPPQQHPQHHSNKLARMITLSADSSAAL